jgi:hypothetical protein
MHALQSVLVMGPAASVSSAAEPAASASAAAPPMPGAAAAVAVDAADDGRIGIYTPAERAELLARYRRKRARRVYGAGKYAERSARAGEQPRVKGKFVSAPCPPPPQCETFVIAGRPGTVDPLTSNSPPLGTAEVLPMMPPPPMQQQPQQQQQQQFRRVRYPVPADVVARANAANAARPPAAAAAAARTQTARATAPPQSQLQSQSQSPQPPHQSSPRLVTYVVGVGPTVSRIDPPGDVPADASITHHDHLDIHIQACIDAADDDDDDESVDSVDSGSVGEISNNNNRLGGAAAPTLSF